jgi:hypothetical protein
MGKILRGRGFAMIEVDVMYFLIDSIAPSLPPEMEEPGNKRSLFTSCRIIGDNRHRSVLASSLRVIYSKTLLP